MINIIELKNKINWQILAKEVTKYNPLFRNSEGVYLKDDWTDFSDIGKIRGGNKRLSYIDYVKIEDKYVSTVKFLFDYYKCEKIQLVSKNIYEDENLRRLKIGRASCRERV